MVMLLGCLLVFSVGNFVVLAIMLSRSTGKPVEQAVREELRLGREDVDRRLTDSFKVVSEQLESVQKGLGEMRTWATGVGDVKRVLTTVNTYPAIGNARPAHMPCGHIRTKATGRERRGVEERPSGTAAEELHLPEEIDGLELEMEPTGEPEPEHV